MNFKLASFLAALALVAMVRAEEKPHQNQDLQDDYLNFDDDENANFYDDDLKGGDDEFKGDDDEHQLDDEAMLSSKTNAAH